MIPGVNIIGGKVSVARANGSTGSGSAMGPLMGIFRL